MEQRDPNLIMKEIGEILNMIDASLDPRKSKLYSHSREKHYKKVAEKKNKKYKYGKRP